MKKKKTRDNKSKLMNTKAKKKAIYKINKVIYERLRIKIRIKKMMKMRK